MIVSSIFVCVSCVVVLSLGVLSWADDSSLLEQGSPFLSSSHNDSLLWGTYRPNLYYGLRTRTPKTVLTGLVWYSQDEVGTKSNWQDRVRHECREGDKLRGYGWLEHNGRDYGFQEIKDPENGIVVSTSFLKSNSHSWSTRVSGAVLRKKGKQPRSLSVILYFGLDGNGEITAVAPGDQPARLSLTPSSSSKGRSSTPKHGLRGLEGPVVLQGITEYIGPFYVVVPETVTETLGHPTQPQVARKRGMRPADLTRVHFLGIRVPSADAWKGKEHVLNALKEQQRLFATYGEDPSDEQGDRKAVKNTVHVTLPDTVEAGSNFFAVQFVVTAPFDIDINFIGGAEAEAIQTIEESSFKSLLSGDPLTAALESASSQFSKRFDEVFNMRSRRLTDDMISFGQVCLSNMIGGMGYFFGEGLVEIDDQIKKTKPSPLYTAVPSRPFFPRGFAWDEGFHQLLIHRWDRSITRDSIAHWFNLMEENGWLPREQILGDEVRSAVPEQFQVQRPLHANPPTLFLAVNSLLNLVTIHKERIESLSSSESSDESTDELDEAKKDLEFLKQVYPRMLKLYSWFLDTQRGPKPNTFAWKGKTVDHCLPSGLDDYPRGLLPNEKERHLDLYTWMVMMTETLSSVGDVLGDDETAQRFKTQSEHLRKHLFHVHLNPKTRLLSDYAGSQPYYKSGPRQSTPALPFWRVDNRCGNLPSANGPTSGCNPYQHSACCSPSGWCGDSKEHCECPQCRRFLKFENNRDEYVWKEDFVDSEGYVNLYPLFFGLIPHDSPTLEATLDLISDESRLWTSFGLRSLSKRSPYFGTGEDYWRGPIWINLNYMTLRGLHRYYTEVNGPYQEKAQTIYQQLRQNLIVNMFSEYHRTGFVWEQYSPLDGKGRKSHPFTGWSALIVLIMAEQYY
eukprot:GILK01006877.1.p1 GENE.GILK01006877.1~~GILK01006877.1.p1  ORF type:complete len:903 (-),score=184.13 GILK01006877.1:173-2881(-)